MPGGFEKRKFDGVCACAPLAAPAAAANVTAAATNSRRDARGSSAADGEIDVDWSVMMFSWLVRARRTQSRLSDRLPRKQSPPSYALRSPGWFRHRHSFPNLARRAAVEQFGRKVRVG